MIRLNGKEAVNRAYYAMKNREFQVPFSTFYIGYPENGGAVPLRPERALAMVRSGEAQVESLICEVESVWDLLLLAERERSIFIHPCRNAVLVFNREQGVELGAGIRAFAVNLFVFEKAAGWAMQSPVVDRNSDFSRFFATLSPRMLLGNEHWVKDNELLRHSIEISRELIRLFRLDSSELWEKLRRIRSAFSGESEPLLHGGHFLDCVLEYVRHAIEEGIGLEELGCGSGVPGTAARSR